VRHAAHFERCVGRGQYADVITKSAVTALDRSGAIGALQPLMDAFLTTVDRISVLGRLAEALRMPPNSTGQLQTTSPTASWVAEGVRSRSRAWPLTRSTSRPEK
jgi:hypothetical protein